MKLRIAVLLLVSVACANRAEAQAVAPTTLWEAEVGYNYVHTNAPPAGCGCFSINGGSASVLREFNPRFGLAGEFNGVTNSNISGTGHSLTLLSYLVGPRYRFVPRRGQVAPFAQILVGAAHASGGLYGTGGTTSGSANGFATSAGGGVDWTLSPRVSVRLVQIDYLLTLLPNGVNSRQNNF